MFEKIIELQNNMDIIKSTIISGMPLKNKDRRIMSTVNMSLEIIAGIKADLLKEVQNA